MPRAKVRRNGRPSHQVNVLLDGDTWDWVRRLAEDNSQSAGEVVRGCIREAQAIDRGEYVSATPHHLAAAPEADHG